MGNHYHLVVETPEANLVAGMRWLQSTYTIRLNHRQVAFFGNDEECVDHTTPMDADPTDSEGKEMAQAAKRLFVSAKNGEVLPLIVAETVYTLTSIYGYDPKDVATTLISIIKQPGVRLREDRIVICALELPCEKNISFADAYLAAVCIGESSNVASFDRDFDRINGVTRCEPK